MAGSKGVDEGGTPSHSARLFFFWLSKGGRPRRWLSLGFSFVVRVVREYSIGQNLSQSTHFHLAAVGLPELLMLSISNFYTICRNDFSTLYILFGVVWTGIGRDIAETFR
jgi:hypothetical protein